MSQKTNTRLIGAFVTASLVLLLGLIVYFGSTRLFTDNVRFVMFFDQSVNGLNVGSLVKFRGVPVGSVERILIRVEGQSEESTSIPVIIRIDASRMSQDLGLNGEVLSGEFVGTSIERGLIGRLNLESFVTGQLFIDFSFEPDKSAVTVRPIDTVDGMVVIPTVGSSLDEITSDVAQIISDLSSADIAQLVTNVNGLLVSSQTFLDGLDSKGMSDSVILAANSFADQLSSESFKESLNSAQNALDRFANTMETYRLDEGPLSQTLAGIDALLARSNQLIEPNSVLINELMTTLRELGRSAQSLRMLTDFLERNPDAILKGRASNNSNE